MQSRTDELVVLLDENNQPVGIMPKHEVHSDTTPYHYAFSCYLFNRAGTHVLMTRRATTKQTWPGVWTNTCCGHPGHTESLTGAAIRRASFELGVEALDLKVAVPEFSYRAVDASGMVENEFCPILIGTLDADPQPNPDEVCDWAWVPWETVVTIASDAPSLLSPWSVEQIQRLTHVLGSDLAASAQAVAGTRSDVRGV
ncbi:isopentenyl-diphosphate Delta-isomerase [Hoyosella rhizosphaerae]|uniref:Isopentenyl-diphosphate Delta-isomerase n=1 Tax=Hoyosella rhizosphaerae TaxID=1755582 RepID=A0A916X965_9ACTN|nr:isopentenyl-diphosphate Delta-isomerase [Hoyosella rhizosphaerae]MBN4926786.1 isopentenyl-diphosphate Delta-isomerase [Hoyosella rhizosphaerae]GGC56455.1 isopentenyl-diphosphate Delta-isomerase [Hoyosella rhizosphaerae]